MFPFDRPINYDGMLNKISLFTLIEAVVLTFLVAHFVAPIAGLLCSLKLPVKVMSIEMPLLYVVPGILIALIARIIRLHDKLSDIFRVRETFDMYRVLLPLAGAVGCAISLGDRKILKSNRKLVMQRTFYFYASFEEPKISKALVLRAIDTWTWYWVLAEFLVLLALAAFILMLFGAFAPAAYLLLAFCLLLILFSTAFAICGTQVDRQIDEIVSDPDRRELLRKEFVRNQAK